MALEASTWDERLVPAMLPLAPPRSHISANHSLSFDDVEHWRPHFDGSKASAVAPTIEEGVVDWPTARFPLVQFDSVPIQTDSTLDPGTRRKHRRSSLDIMHGVDIESEGEESDDSHVGKQLVFGDQDVGAAPVVEDEVEKPEEAEPVSPRSRSSSLSSAKSSDSTPVDWVELDKTEECKAREEGSDEVQCHQVNTDSSRHGLTCL